MHLNKWQTKYKTEEVMQKVEKGDFSEYHVTTG